MEYAELVASNTRGQEVEEMEMTWADKIERRARRIALAQGRDEGRSEGRREGRREGAKKVLALLLEQRFGALDPVSLRRFEAIDDVEELEGLSRRLLSATSLADLGLKS